MTGFWAILAGVFLCSCGLTWAVRRLALRHQLLDIPNQRSSHSLPTPRGGGLALLLAFYLGAGFLVFSRQIDVPSLTGLGLCGLGIALAGFCDDLYRISPAKRILVHFFCASVAIHYFTPVQALVPLAHGAFLFTVKMFLVVAVVWLLNLFNFMDGIDGLAGSEAMFAALGSGVILLLFGETADYPPLLAVLAAATLGFLVWNLPPARIFMGDACSGFLGFCFGMLSLLTIAFTSLNLWTWLLLLGLFVVDATVTLAVRVLRGEKFWQAHRSHAYQILSRRMGSHLKVTLGYLGINCFFLFPLACLSVYKPDHGPALVFVSYAVLIASCIRIGAGTTDE